MSCLPWNSRLSTQSRAATETPFCQVCATFRSELLAGPALRLTAVRQTRSAAELRNLPAAADHNIWWHAETADKQKPSSVRGLWLTVSRFQTGLSAQGHKTSQRNRLVSASSTNAATRQASARGPDSRSATQLGSKNRQRGREQCR